MYFATTHLMLQSIMWRNITEYQVTKHDRVSWDEILQSIM